MVKRVKRELENTSFPIADHPISIPALIPCALTEVSSAYQKSIHFSFVSGTHGWTRSLNKLQNGIQIKMRKLNSSIINSDGKSATIGGGTLKWEVTRDLYAQGKQTVTGLCECVSVIGPLLGGGHGLLQNQYGFALDNIVSANVILANGTTAVASNSKNGDLFWALRGAGQNFGVVTSFRLKAYDVPAEKWTVYSLIYSSDNLEKLFELVNTLDAPGNIRPAKLFTAGVLIRVPDVDANPIFIYTVAYEGSEADVASHVAPFLALNPLSTTLTPDVAFADLYTVTGNGKDSGVCIKDNNILGSGASLLAWNTTDLRSAYNIFSKLTADSRFSTSAMLLESYGLNGVRAVDPASTALAPKERERPILTTPVVWWAGNYAKTRDEAYAYAKSIRDALYTGVSLKRHAYVNYAVGDETVEEMYGYEKWRLEKLRQLKAKWDPQNTFKWYNP